MGTRPPDSRDPTTHSQPVDSERVSSPFSTEISPRSSSRCPQGRRRMVLPSATKSERPAPRKADLSEFFSFARREQNRNHVNTRQCWTTEKTCRAGRGSCVIEPCKLRQWSLRHCDPRSHHHPLMRGPVTHHRCRHRPETLQGPRAGGSGHRQQHRGLNRGAWHRSRDWCWAGSCTFSTNGVPFRESQLHSPCRRMGLERNAQ